MPQPRLIDDGTSVSIDLHGASVAEGIELVRRAAAVAADRGRTSLRVIHGTSTSDPRARNRTLRHALHDLLDEDGLPEARGTFRAEGHTLIDLGIARQRDPTPIRLLDLVLR